MTTGTVKWFNNAKGFGFIRPEISGNSLFGAGILTSGSRIPSSLLSRHATPAKDFFIRTKMIHLHHKNDAFGSFTEAVK